VFALPCDARFCEFPSAEVRAASGVCIVEVSAWPRSRPWRSLLGDSRVATCRTTITMRNNRCACETQLKGNVGRASLEVQHTHLRQPTTTAAATASTR
jgi:hypothetical protein